MTQLNQNLLASRKAAFNAEQIQMFQTFVHTGRNLVEHYNVALWSIGMILAVYFGTVLLTRQRELLWNHKFLKLPSKMVYFLIAVLFLTALPQTHETGLNLLLSLAPLYLAQGVAILDFF